MKIKIDYDYEVSLREMRSRWWNMHLRFIIVVPGSCYDHVANDVNRNYVQCELVVAHYAADCAASDFHNNAGDAVYIINPSGKWLHNNTIH